MIDYNKIQIINDKEMSKSIDYLNSIHRALNYQTTPFVQISQNEENYFDFLKMICIESVHNSVLSKSY